MLVRCRYGIIKSDIKRDHAPVQGVYVVRPQPMLAPISLNSSLFFRRDA